MLEEILKHRPKGATHWDVGTYYKKDGDKWFYWDRLWFRVADISTLNMWMTTLPEDKEPAMSEFEGKSGKWAWEVQKEQQAKVEELQKRLDAALKETQFALQYVEDDMRGNHEFLKMAMIRVFKDLEQVLKGGEFK
ncbi:hypothetical protein ACT4YK_06215 [Acinetobacter baumannii]